MTKTKFTYCPDCHHKSVYLQFKPQEDNYRCRMPDCDFYFFADPDGEQDRKNEARWKDLNKDKD
jgi:hypothetical protein